jgi:hypothetical protein
MDLVVPPGAVLGCVAIGDYLQRLVSGDIVVMVRRNELGLFETTLKQYAVEGGRHYLVSRAGDSRLTEKEELVSPLDQPAATGYQDFFIHAVALSYAASLPAAQR